MKPSQGSATASSSLRTTDRSPISWYHLGKERTKRSQEVASCAPTSGHITYRGIRGLKHRNDRIHHRTAPETTIVTDAPLEQTASERQPPRQNVGDQCLRSSDQPRPVHTSSSSRRSVSADRQTSSSTSAPRTFFETLYRDKVLFTLCTKTQEILLIVTTIPIYTVAQKTNQL